MADASRFLAPGASSSLAVVAVGAALAGRPALLGYLRGGRIPASDAKEPGGELLLVTNYSSRQLETVNLARPP